jgi:hypothetical protein
MFYIQIPRAYQYSYHEKKRHVLLFFNALLNVHKASADVRVVHGETKKGRWGSPIIVFKPDPVVDLV